MSAGRRPWAPLRVVRPPAYPIAAVATEVILMAGPRPGIPGTPPGQWRTIAAFPLASDRPERQPTLGSRNDQIPATAAHGASILVRYGISHHVPTIPAGTLEATSGCLAH